MYFNKQVYIAFQTIVAKEIGRVLRIWIQTLVPPVITVTLYFLIFGRLIGHRIGTMDGIPYMQYIVPGLIMMQVIMTSYSNVVSSFYGSKYQKNLEEMLIAPVPNVVILLGFITGGAVRGLITGTIVLIVSLFFVPLHVNHIVITLIVVILSAVLFALAGFINAIYAKSFDEISIIPTFVLTPLTYLGGVFYSIHLLPKFWTNVSFVNPVLYIVNAFRYGILGISDVNLYTAFGFIIIFISLLFSYSLSLLNRGVGIKT